MVSYEYPRRSLNNQIILGKIFTFYFNYTNRKLFVFSPFTLTDRNLTDKNGLNRGVI